MSIDQKTTELKYADLFPFPEKHSDNEPPVVVHLGDSTLLAALRTVGAGYRTIVIDPQQTFPHRVIAELQASEQVFSFLASERSKIQNLLASILVKILANPEKNQIMQTAYSQAWQQALANMDLLSYYPHSIEDVLKEIYQKPNGVIAVANTVTYHYPSPGYNPLFPALELAARILKPEGQLIVTSESKVVIDDIAQYVRKFVTNNGFVHRGDSDDYVSAYDVAWGEKGHFQVVITNHQGQLPEYILKLKQTHLFRLMKFLRMIQ